MATMQLDAIIPESVADGAATLTIRDVANMTGVSIGTLKYLQLGDMGPSYSEERGCIRYSVESVADWQAKRSQAHQRLMDSYRA